ncbi:MAG: transposase [Candidatus Omnitrophota bacterium]
MVLNEYGEIACKCWGEIPEHFSHVALYEYSVMPNHVHGIINIRRGTACRAPTMECFGKPVIGSLSTIIRSFKSAVTKQINAIYNTSGTRLWQRNFYEHVIRDENDLTRVREYIINNPINWELDEYYEK